MSTATHKPTDATAPLACVSTRTLLDRRCALVDIRRDDDLDCPLTLNRQDPYLFRPNANPALLQASEKERRASTDPIKPPTGAGEGELERTKTKTHRSHRMHTTPMQMMLNTRRSLMSQLDADVNSFEAIESDSDQKPHSYASTAADMRCRVRRNNTEASIFASETGHACVGTSSASDVSRAKLRRGSLTQKELVKAAIFLKANKNLLKRLAQ